MEDARKSFMLFRQAEKMTNPPEISVVMGVYNGAAYLRETIESILSQKGVDFEFIIVNDGATDYSGDILREYADRDNRVRVFEQDNQGLTISLIRGCAEARGKYIARQDAGDLSLPERLRLQKNLLDIDREVAFVSCWTEVCGPKDEFLYLVRSNGLAIEPKWIMQYDEIRLIDGPTCHASVMMRKDHYVRAGGYRAGFYYAQDFDLWYRIANIGKFQHIEKPLYKARILPESISAQHKNEQEQLAQIIVKATAMRRDGQSDDEMLSEAATIRPSKNLRRKGKSNAEGLYFIGKCLLDNQDHRALEYFCRSIFYKPFALKAWVGWLRALLYLPFHHQLR